MNALHINGNDLTLEAVREVANIENRRAALLAPDALRETSVVMFVNTTGEIAPSTRDTLLQWIANGGSFIGVHSASDTWHESPEYIEMLGGEFLTHPDQTTRSIFVERQKHPATESLESPHALFEEFYYDDDGNPANLTLAEYPFPSAAELPSFELVAVETPTPFNSLGAKGIGESGTIGATPAVLNAAIDALSHLGVRHLDMPLTPERVWRALRARAA